MTTGLVFAIAGAQLFFLGVYSLIVHTHLLRRILALNVMGSATFLAIVGMAQRAQGAAPDPLAHALVLTGIVVAVSASALALALLRQLVAAGGGTALEEDREA